MEFKLPILPEGFEWIISKKPMNGSLMQINIWKVGTTERYAARRIEDRDVVETDNPVIFLSEVFIGMYDELIAELDVKKLAEEVKVQKQARLEAFKKLMDDLP